MHTVRHWQPVTSEFVLQVIIISFVRTVISCAEFVVICSVLWPEYIMRDSFMRRLSRKFLGLMLAQAVRLT